MVAVIRFGVMKLFMFLGGYSEGESEYETESEEEVDPATGERKKRRRSRFQLKVLFNTQLKLVVVLTQKGEFLDEEKKIKKE